jgi:hypothetical protein
VFTVTSEAVIPDALMAPLPESRFAVPASPLAVMLLPEVVSVTSPVSPRGTVRAPPPVDTFTEVADGGGGGHIMLELTPGMRPAGALVA